MYMKVLLIQAHPNARSFSTAIAERIEKGFLEGEWTSEASQVISRSLYGEDFYPVLAFEEMKSRYSFDPVIQEHIDNVLNCDCVFFIHPDWWGQPPAILKGWIDRVFRPGIAFDYCGSADREPVPRLSGKKGFVIITTNLKYSEEHQFYFEELWNKRVFGLCGIEPCGVEVFYDMRHSTYGERARWLENISLNISSWLKISRK